MKTLSTLWVARLLMVLNVLLVINIFWAWVFVRFVHYHAQYSSLSPDDFTAEVVTKAELAKLADPAIREVEFADGRTLVKSQAWDDLQMASAYAPASDGKLYVRVTSKGTAIFSRRWGENTVLLLIFALPALLLSIWHFAREARKAQPDQIPDGGA